MKSIFRRTAVLVAALTAPAFLMVAGCTTAGDPAPRKPQGTGPSIVRAGAPPHSLAAIDVCQGLTGEMVAACLVLADRPAEANSEGSNPDGIALVGECRADTALFEDELYACLSQPRL